MQKKYAEKKVRVPDVMKYRSTPRVCVCGAVHNSGCNKQYNKSLNALRPSRTCSIKVFFTIFFVCVLSSSLFHEQYSERK